MQAIAETRISNTKQFSQIETRFDPEYGALWGFMNPTAPANIQFSLFCLKRVNSQPASLNPGV